MDEYDIQIKRTLAGMGKFDFNKQTKFFIDELIEKYGWTIKDLRQECRAKIIRDMLLHKQDEEKAKMPTYLGVCFRNMLSKLWRREMRHSIAAEYNIDDYGDASWIYNKAHVQSPEELYLEKEKENIIMVVLDEIWYAHFNGDVTKEELIELECISEKTFYRYKSKLIKKLKEVLEINGYELKKK